MSVLRRLGFSNFNSLKKKGDVAGLAEHMRTDPRLCPSAAKALAELGTAEAVQALVGVLRDPDVKSGVRVIAADSLAEIAGPNALQALVEVARGEPIAEARSYAVRALGQRQEDVFDTLVTALSDPDFGVRSNAASSLVKGRDPRALEPLIGALSDPAANVRSSAVQSLGYLGDRRAAEPLRALASDPDRWVRERAEEAYDKQIEEAEREASGGLAIGYTPKEVFLASKLAVFMTHREVFDSVPGKGSDVAIRAAFPALCSGCLDPTGRTVGLYGSLSWQSVSRRGSVRETITTSVNPRWRIPLCERCGSYGLRALTRITAHDIDRDRWVSFRFPNIACCRPFVEANGLEWGTRVTSVGPLTMKVGQDRRDTEALEAALTSWSVVEERLGGLHRYLAAKRGLVEIEERFEPDGLDDRRGQVAAEVRRFATDLSMSIDQLEDVARVANERFLCLNALQDSGQR